MPLSVTKPIRPPQMASTYLQPVSPRRRAISVGLTLLVHALLVLLLLNLSPDVFVPMGDQGALTTFNVGPPAVTQERKAAERPRPAERTRERESAEPPPRPTVPRPPVPVPRPDQPADTSGVIWMDRDSFAKTDITGKGSADDRGDSADTGADSKAPYGPGQGPGGAQLFTAEWVREPTDCRAAHLPAGRAQGQLGHDRLPDRARQPRRQLPHPGRIAAGLANLHGDAPRRLAVPGSAAAHQRQTGDRRLGAHPDHLLGSRGGGATLAWRGGAPC